MDEEWLCTCRGKDELAGILTPGGRDGDEAGIRCALESAVSGGGGCYATQKVRRLYNVILDAINGTVLCFTKLASYPVWLTKLV
jgi:hypothetical protein